jgi:hypothetical protein
MYIRSTESLDLARVSSRMTLRLVHQTKVALAFASVSTAPVTRPSATDYHWVQVQPTVSIMRSVFELAQKRKLRNSPL